MHHNHCFAPIGQLGPNGARSQALEKPDPVIHQHSSRHVVAALCVRKIYYFVTPQGCDAADILCQRRESSSCSRLSEKPEAIQSASSFRSFAPSSGPLNSGRRSRALTGKTAFTPSAISVSKLGKTGCSSKAERSSKRQMNDRRSERAEQQQDKCDQGKKGSEQRKER